MENTNWIYFRKITNIPGSRLNSSSPTSAENDNAQDKENWFKSFTCLQEIRGTYFTYSNEIY